MIANPVPVFVISFNRGEWLSRCIAACKQLVTPVDIVVHDNGSDDPATVRCLDLIEAEGITVVRRAKIRDSAELNQINDTIGGVALRRPMSSRIATSTSPPPFRTRSRFITSFSTCFPTRPAAAR